ncbi:tectonic-like complex member MKS1 [Watersipora subatra]|uniref:tectonic-like complex member MKS1 n=1 Tax=Watersipora subatra TaxID=2589382 RepID=UPI00355BC1B8
MARETGSSDFGTVFYRSKDSIKNLRIKVHLQKVTSSSIVPQAEIEQKLGPSSSNHERREIQRQQELMSQKEEETCTVQWQQKLYSQREFNMYKHEENCDGVIEKKYHKEIVNQSERPTKRLFTYVNHDKFTNQREGIQKMTTSPNEKPTPLAEKVANVRRRRTATSSRLLSSEGIAPKVNIVDNAPSVESQRRNHVIVTPEQTFWIMADLSARDQIATEDDEHVLCSIKVDANGVITMKPNFNQSSKPYRIETDSLGKEVYLYTLENCSSAMSNSEKVREEKMYNELYSRHSQYLSSLVGSEFELPPLGVLRLILHGQIVSARNFEYDDLFVRYVINVPSQEQGWGVESNFKLAGVTQTCITKVEGRDNVAFFSFPFDAEMFYKRPAGEGDQTGQVIKSWPKIFFEICSLDSWSRFRPEGYCAVTIPNTPGEHSVELNTWRPVGPSVVSNLRRFFIGGAPELEDLSYVYIPSTFQGSHLSRFGFKTESSGSLKIKLSVMLQSQDFCFSKKAKRAGKKDALMAQLGSTVDYTEIRAVIDAFSKAHGRMQLARKNALNNLRELSLDDTMTVAAETAPLHL